jgi:hypothetical protein
MNNPFEAETEGTSPPALSSVLEKAHLSRQKLEVERVIGRGQFGEVRGAALLFFSGRSYICQCSLADVILLLAGLFGAAERGGRSHIPMRRQETAA